jgi:ribonuclease E
MATKKMLIDASHPEETRVVILGGNRLENFDVEVESRKQLKGSIYLAKVTRVEPSLQAAFVDYGENRHGFLAFNEIHPDYYQIPVADRKALIAEETLAEEAELGEDDLSGNDDKTPSSTGAGEDSEGDEGISRDAVENIGGDDTETEEAPKRRSRASSRRYKIQEVIKRRQILLVQVVKEERGSKGAALTTYISLAGRYCVLVPNTSKGGVSRKITNAADRKRLKGIVANLGIPEGMGIIVRTAGAKRTKAEIRRDYEYLFRLWDNIRDRTLKSTAPCLIHEEGNLIKRSIRDLYRSDIEEIIVEGEDGYRAAKDFIRLLVPSHTKRVQPHRDKNVPLFQHYQVERQLDAIHSPEVQLKSGGYIVINPTEALVSIDVNSGRATKERNIEETASKTNLEAADEVARQLRLRDLSGLIVIDFIDMDMARNRGQVERRLRDAMRDDRARIQLGKISPFGLLELSRQRLRPSLIETSSEPCPYCAGTGVRRSTDSAALDVLRAIEEEGQKSRSQKIVVHVSTPIALYILNQKRDSLAATEERYGFSVELTGDDSLIPPDLRIERTGEKADESEADKPAGEEKDTKRRRRRKPRGQRKTHDDSVATSPENKPETAAKTPDGDNAAASDISASNEASEEVAKDANASKRPRRRGKRGGRRRGRKPETQAAENANTPQTTSAEGGSLSSEDARAPQEVAIVPDDSGAKSPEEAPSETHPLEPAAEKSATPEKKPRRRRTRKPAAAAAPQEAPSVAPPPEVVVPKPEPVIAPPPEANAFAENTTVVNVGEDSTPTTDKPSRNGWWRLGK